MTYLQMVMRENEMSYAVLAAELGVCELSARNKAVGKSKLTKPELLCIKNLFNLTDEQISMIKEENKNA